MAKSCCTRTEKNPLKLWKTGKSPEFVLHFIIFSLVLILVVASFRPIFDLNFNLIDNMQHQQQSHFRTIFLTSFSVEKSNFDSDYFPNWWKKLVFARTVLSVERTVFPPTC